MDLECELLCKLKSHLLLYNLNSDLHTVVLVLTLKDDSHNQRHWRRRRCITLITLSRQVLKIDANNIKYKKTTLFLLPEFGGARSIGSGGVSYNRALSALFRVRLIRNRKIVKYCKARWMGGGGRWGCSNGVHLGG